MTRTDKAKLMWPKGITAKTRQLSRKIYAAIGKHVANKSCVIGCSGGLDSTVLAHACRQFRILSGSSVRDTLMYVNHNLRPLEVEKEAGFVCDLAESLGCDVCIKSVYLSVGNTQAKARERRYAALVDVACGRPILTAHHANDVAETKLWQFVTGRPAEGIKPVVEIGGGIVYRPLLVFLREELDDYAKAWKLEWKEDSSNKSLKYSRNKVRHELIPWVENNLNSGVVRMLAGV